MYLLNDLRLREKVALIAMELSGPINRIMTQKPLKAPAHTALAGEGTVYYNTVPATAFHYMGRLTDHVDSVAVNLAGMLSHHPPRNVQDSDLIALRVADPES
jgi:hypothetical protein